MLNGFGDAAQVLEIAINLSASFHAINAAGARDRDEAKRSLLAENQPSGEFARPASQIRGASLSIDGGWTAQ